MKLSGSNVKKFLIFSQRKTFLYFGKRKPRKNSLYFRKRNFLIFQEITFRAQKLKKAHSEKVSYISENGTFLPKKA